MDGGHEELGIIGLGRMGGGLALQALGKGMRVVGFTREGARAELHEAGLDEAQDLAHLVAALEPPRKIFLYIPAGPAVDAVLSALAPLMAAGDIVVDGGNSYWIDSMHRAQRLLAQGIQFVDLGTSGGVSGAREGACFMVGGAAEAVQQLEPLLRSLAVPGGFVHAGPSGAGHFTKLVHNGIEFGMLEAIGEGISMLEAYEDKLPVGDILQAWRHGSVIRSWLIDLLEAAYRREGNLDRIPPYVEDTGEVSWLVLDALRMEVPVPVISQAVMQLFSSRDHSKAWAKAIALMRQGFGGHPLGPSPAVARIRHDEWPHDIAP